MLSKRVLLFGAKTVCNKPFLGFPYKKLSLPPVCHMSQSCQDKGQHCVAIVGGGPAGFYTTQQLLKGDPNVVVDIYEKLPIPFGLVRYGVAPDHPEVKNVINSFTKTAGIERCNFLGNIEVGRDVSVQDLRNAYSAVVLCYGAEEDRCLGIPGEDAKNVVSAKSFVGWYNGLPEDKDLKFNLDCQSVVVFGHGNVALDVARILLTPIKILEKTDICEHALDTLRKSKVKTVHLVGRRGPLQVAFTIKELREMVKLPETKPVINAEEVEFLGDIIKDLPRPKKRLTELLYKTGVAHTSVSDKLASQSTKQWMLHFCRSPVKINVSSEGCVSSVDLAINKLEGDSLINQKAISTSETENMSCGLVIRSIGYKSLPIDECIPFDKNRSVIPNTDSRVENEPGLYVTGWVGTGPAGVINDTMIGSFQTGKVVLSDLKEGILKSKDADSRNSLVGSFDQKAVTFKDWEKIDLVEQSEGEKRGKPREKMVNVEDMMNVLGR